jgi:predicted RNA-binding protein with PIN domain
MLYLIDGYNLLYALGLVSKHMPPAGLEKARQRLLGMLAGAFGDEGQNVTVIFDAAHPPPGVAAEQDYKGIQIRFAVELATADELIELLIRRASAPKNLTIVSDDHRIQNAARRRRCVVNGCGDFLQALERRRQQPPAPQVEETKPVDSSGADKAIWLKEFADLDDDLKTISEPKEFFEEDFE